MVGQHGWRFRVVVALFLAPSLVPLVLFLVVPIVSSIGLSFVSWDLLTSPHWVGLANYRGL
ncbi:MAG: multiple sugar transport system permease protein, partial [Gaiellaceae bacterium]|nr:multiple sugar transport system permease protein [Gaiellaceae bacterium]